MQRVLCNCLWDIRKIMPDKYRLQGQYPLVFVNSVRFQLHFLFSLKKTTAPSDILWENLDLTGFESFLRKLTSSVIVFFLMLITFVIIFAAQLKGAVQLPLLLKISLLNFLKAFDCRLPKQLNLEFNSRGVFWIS